MSLSDKVAIVTGGGRGIGQAIVQKLAELEATVVINDIDESAEPFFQPHPRELVVGLYGQCHPDKCSGNHNDRHAFDTDYIHLRPD